MQSTKIKKATFKHIEAELYSYHDNAKEIKEINKELVEWKERSENLRYETMLSYVKRILWLEKLLNSFEEINDKLDKEIKFFILLKYKEKLNYKKISTMIDLPVKKLKLIHRLIVEAMIEKLGMNYESGDKFFEESRYIPTEVKTQVAIRDNNSCVNCGSSKKIHFHHIEHFSEGGLHEIDNIKILCSKCHAKEHIGEKAYHLLKEVNKCNS